MVDVQEHFNVTLVEAIIYRNNIGITGLHIPECDRAAAVMWQSMLYKVRRVRWSGVRVTTEVPAVRYNPSRSCLYGNTADYTRATELG